MFNNYKHIYFFVGSMLLKFVHSLTPCDADPIKSHAESPKKSSGRLHKILLIQCHFELHLELMTCQEQPEHIHIPRLPSTSVSSVEYILSKEIRHSWASSGDPVSSKESSGKLWVANVDEVTLSIVAAVPSEKSLRINWSFFVLITEPMIWPFPTTQIVP